MLEAKGPARPMRPVAGFEARSIYHRTFGLSVDAAASVALFRTRAQNACVIARDQEKSLPLRVPVFFVGRAGEPPEDLSDDAERVAFAPSARLGNGDDFTGISFYLSKGGSAFSDIRPFFVCGLPGLMLCKGYCPGDAVTLAELLVDAAVQGQASQPPANAAKSAAAPVTEPVEPPSQPTTPPVVHVKPPEPEPAASSPPTASPSPPVNLPPVAATAPPPAAEAVSNSESPSHPSRRLVLVFRRNSGAAIGADDVIEAEGAVLIRGVPLRAEADGLAGELPDETFAASSTPEVLQRLFPHYQISAAKPEGARILVTAEPLFLPASDLTVKISGAAQALVRGCDLGLNVAQHRRLGSGWTKIPDAGTTRGLRFREDGAGYALELPESVSKNQVLIDTAEDGDVAKLSNVAAACDLEARPYVTAQELRSGRILRSVRKTGKMMIALVSTDSELSRWLDGAKIEGFWSAALDLAGSVSEGPWQRKLLARGQFPGPSEETGVLEDLNNGRLAKGAGRDEILRTLTEASHPRPDPLAITGSQPIERYHLGLALEPINVAAGTDPDGGGEQALLLIRGSVEPNGSYFCRTSARPEAPPAGRLFVLEIWSAGAAAAFQKISLAKPAEGAPDGVYLCSGFGNAGIKIALYGVVPSALAESTRASVFAYLTEQANSYLRP